MVFKRSTLADKLVKLCGSVRTADQLNSEGIKHLLERVYNIEAKQRSSRIFREVLEAVALEDFLTADELLRATLTILAQLSQFCSSDMMRDTHKVATILARISGYFTEVLEFDGTTVRSLYNTILKVIRASQGIIPSTLDEVMLPELEADRRELLMMLEAKRKNSSRTEENLCTPFLNMINNIRKNSELFTAMHIKSIAEVLPSDDVTDPQLQKFLLATLPDLTNQ